MPTDLEQLVREGAERLLGRAGEVRSLDTAAVAPRVRATVEKYLLRHSPQAGAKQVKEFIDALHAEEELAVALPGEQPVEERGARGADVQVAGRGRCEADADSHIEKVVSKQ